MTREGKQNKRKLKSNFLPIFSHYKIISKKTLQSVYVFTMLHESLFTGAQRQNFGNVEFLSD